MEKLKAVLSNILNISKENAEYLLYGSAVVVVCALIIFIVLLTNRKHKKKVARSRHRPFHKRPFDAEEFDRQHNLTDSEENK